MKRILAILLALTFAAPAKAADVTVAVASNFQTTLEALKPGFEAASGHKLIIVAGATGKLATQIMEGAPFDVFLSADDKAPAKLAAGGHGLKESEFTYAIGTLALYAPQGGDGLALLKAGSFQHLAIANPKLAPYGVAAEETLAGLGLADAVKPKIVMGENIAQAFTMAASGNAELAFVALPQVKGKPGSFWQVPADAHAPIRQNAIAVREGEAAAAFLAYLKSDEGRGVIAQAGYGLP